MALDARDRLLLRLTVAVVRGDWDVLRAVRRAAPAGQPDRAWREALLQAHLFAGLPRIVEASAVLVQEGGLGAVAPDELEAVADVAEAGRVLFERIYAGKADQVRAELERGHPLLARWVLEHAYGRVLARPGLGADRRELLAVVALASLGQDRQLASHARGALRCGVTAAALDEAFDAVADQIDEADLRRARRVVERFAAG